MNIEINPKLAPLFTKLAQGQGMTDEMYAVHVLEKYAFGQLRNQTAESIRDLDIDDLSQIKTNIDVAIESKKPPVVVDEPADEKIK